MTVLRTIEENTMISLIRLATLLALLFTANALHAEPYLAIKTGLKCMVCHVNPAGGGKRTAYGQIYGQTTMPAKPTTSILSEVVSRHLDIGGDLRTSTNYASIPDTDNELDFETERATVYIEGKLIPERLTFYLDQRFAPGVSSREAWLMYQTEDKDWFLKAGTFFLPYGLRLEDDSAFIRDATKVNFNNADKGIMIGNDNGPWSTRLSLTNGTNGGAETNKDKQASLRLAYIQPKWRVGTSGNVNPGTDGESRTMYNLFGGLNMFGIEWMAEMDWITDSFDDSRDITQEAFFIEADKEFVKGQNWKLSYDYLDPDSKVNEDQRNRISLIWEYTPISLMQIRVGGRVADGIPQDASQNTDTVFAQLHVWF